LQAKINDLREKVFSLNIFLLYYFSIAKPPLFKNNLTSFTAAVLRSLSLKEHHLEEFETEPFKANGVKQILKRGIEMLTVKW
jgi:hypothetical protein